MACPFLAFLPILPAAFLVQEGPPAPFRESTLAGVRTSSGGATKDTILEVNGGGIVLGDFDADGDHDVVVIDGSTLERVAAEEPGFPPRLFENDGRGVFEPAAEAWAMSGGRWGMGGTAADWDGDGDLDLVVTEWGPDRLLLNESNAGWVELPSGKDANASGLAGSRWGTSAAALDYDGDGYLDLAVVNYLAFDPEVVPSRTSGACRWKGMAVMCGPEGLTPVHDQLYRNRGTGRFEEVSAASGFRPREAGFGLGITTLDYDVDGDVDLYVTNDSTPNHLWENQGDGSWKEVGLRRGAALDANGKEQAGMGIAVGDVNSDDVPDLLVTNFSGESNALYLSSARGRFRERAAPAGLGGPSLRLLGWGTALEDFDLDGDLDAVVLNGHVYPQADAPGTDTSYAQLDGFFRSDGKGRFELERLSAAEPGVSRALAAGDLNDDGRPDLVALDLDGPVRVLINQEGSQARGLRVRLVGRGANTQGLGARVTVSAGDRRTVREMRTAGGFQSGLPAELCFGLGAAERVDRVHVRWLSGAVSVVENVEADQVLVVREPETAPEPGDGSGDTEVRR